MFKNLIPWRHANDTDMTTTDTSDDVARFRGNFDQLLGRLFDVDGDSERSIGWGCEVRDGEDAVSVRAEAPGFEPDEFDVQLSGNRLIIQAEHREEAKKGNGSQAHYGRLYRSLTVPSGIEADRIDATYKNGVLEVTLPKEESAKSKRIKVAAK
tara:strand:- start:160663 stop:161124 length:462 start_codon:yes stop_codon:yes gene_type:complete